MPKRQREGEFKLGQLHGKVLNEENKSEAHIRQTIFLSQRLKLWRAKGETLVIRIFGYEIPLKKDCKRGECVDLMGYDREQNLYLIELKKEKSSEKLGEIATQIDKYKDAVEEIRSAIEKDFEKEFFFHISFKEIKKIVLAPREFYKEKKRKGEALVDRDAIEYAYFRDKSIYKHKLEKIIHIHLVEKMKCN
jgi:hypothetical protein